MGTTFKTFSEALVSLYNKAEDQTATYEDGVAVRTYWKDKKRTLHVWIPHTSIENVDYQLNEALGYLYEKKYDDALPKIEVLIEMAKKSPSPTLSVLKTSFNKASLLGTLFHAIFFFPCFPLFGHLFISKRKLRLVKYFLRGKNFFLFCSKFLFRYHTLV